MTAGARGQEADQHTQGGHLGYHAQKMDSSGGKRGRGRAIVVVAVVLVGVGGAAGWVVVNGGSGGSAQATASPGVATSTAEVVKSDIAARRLVNGTLGYSGTFDVMAGRTGVVTWVPALGSVIGRGRSAFEIDGVAVPLLYGERPAWRDLRLGISDGEDVRQLERNLVALGYGKGLTVDRHFSWATYRAVRRWQKAAKLTVTGHVPLGQVVFVPAAVRVGGHDLKVGAVVTPGQLVVHGTGKSRAVLVQLSPAVLPQIHVGDTAAVTLPDGSDRKGRISSVGAVADNSASGSANDSGSDSDSTSVAPVTITLTGQVRGFLDQAQVQVQIVSEQHKGVLAVPTTALLARPGGTYEVVVVDGSTRTRVPVQTGLFDESSGLAEVTGDLTPGMLVEVPSDGA
jgi:HlyD family secretion protein